MVRIPAGAFVMGSAAGWPDERPPHRVRIRRPYWLGQTEVTQGVWRAVMKTNPAEFRLGDDFPVERVSWNDAQTFLSRLSRSCKRAFRLPSEAEWEYACRAGATADIVPGLDGVAWTAGNAAGSSHPVAAKRANPFGLFDMLGNVWEWCADAYDAEYYARSPRDDPRGPVDGFHRVDRGGCWAHGRELARPARRDGSGADYRSHLIGLRLAADMEP